jgi:hypothetical protein
MKSLTDIVKDFVVGAVVGVAALGGVSAKADILSGAVPISSFKDFVDKSVPIKTVGMPYGTNLEELKSMPPASIVEKGSHWHMGFVNYRDDGGAEVVGYAKNHYKDVEGFQGWIIGSYLETMGDGNRSDDVWVVHDGNGDGLGYVYNSVWYLGDDDDIYFSGDIMFGPDKIYGDVSQLPVFTPRTAPDYLPEMIVDDRPVRDGPARMEDLVALAENWLSEDCHPYNNADCNGADWNYDGKVNLVDFSLMAEGWNPGYVSE